MSLNTSTQSSVLQRVKRLLQKNIWKGGRRTLLAIVIFFIAAWFIADFTEIFSYPQAILWHCSHGNYIYIDGHRMKLPLVWWNDGDQYSHSPTFRRARLTAGVPPMISINYLQPGMRITSTEELVERHKRAVEFLNARHSAANQSSLFTITTHWLPLQCENMPMVLESNGTSYVLDVRFTMCDAPGLDSSISYSGPSSAYKEAESILSSLQ